MRYLWSRILIMILAAEGALFVLYYNFGPRGIRALYHLKKVKAETLADIKNLQDENRQLQDDIDAWKHDIFLIEKFAREKLALQKEGEVVYYKNL